MAAGSLCEPIDVSPERWVRVERIAHPADQDAPGRFAHFHDAVELVFFHSARGELICEDGVFPIEDGTAALIPSMRHHDFVIGPGPRHWVLVQIDPTLLAGPLTGVPQCLAATLAGSARDRMTVLFDWLEELAADDSPDRRRTLAQLAELTLAEVVTHAAAGPQRADARLEGLDRLRPALDLVAKDPASPPTLEDAAAVCHLSPAYFSRRFKRVFDTNFSDYVRSYRLRLAAQRLVSGGARVSEIAFSLGFATPAHFAMLFQKRFGVSPRAYRAGRRGQDLDDK